MSVNLTINGTTYAYPETNETGWGDAATGWAQAVTTGMLSKAGGSFILTSEIDFGATYGVKLPYLKSRTASPATTGFLRLAASDGMYWRNPANSGNYGLTMDGSGQLLWRGVVLSTGSALTAADVANVPSGNLTATNVQAALNELQGDIDTTNATLSAHTGASTGVHGVSGSVVGTTSTQTLTNKTISGSSNTITNIPNSATTGTASVIPDTLVLRSGTGDIYGNTVYGNQASFLMLNVEDGGLGTITTDYVQAGIVSASNVVGSVSLEAPLVTSGVATLNVRTRANDGASAVGMKFFTFTPLVTAGAKPFKFENGSEIAYFDHVGDFHLLQGLTVSNAVNANEVFASYVEAGASGLYNAGTSTLIGTVTAGPLISNTLTAKSGQMLELRGRTADGAAAVGVTIGPDIDYSVSGSKAIRFMKGSWEMGHFNKDSALILGGNLQCANVVAGGIFGSSGSLPVTMTGTMSNGATAIGVKLDAGNALSTSGANIAVFTNASVEKLAVDKDGNFDFLNGTAYFKYVNASSKFLTNQSLQITNGGGNAVLTTDNLEVNADTNIYGVTYCQNGLNTDPAANVATGTVAADTFNPNQNDGLLFQSNSAGGSTGTDFAMTSSSIRTAGKLFSVQNNTTPMVSIGWGGQLIQGNVGDSTGTPGAATLNTPVGKSKFAASASTLTITNNLVASSNAVIYAVLVASDATLTQILRVVPSSGSFVITGNAAATAATEVRWFIVHAG